MRFANAYSLPMRNSSAVKSAPGTDIDKNNERLRSASVELNKGRNKCEIKNFGGLKKKKCFLKKINFKVL